MYDRYRCMETAKTADYNSAKKAEGYVLIGTIRSAQERYYDEYGINHNLLLLLKNRCLRFFLSICLYDICFY